MPHGPQYDCNLWRSRGRIFAHCRPLLVFIFTVLVGRNFVSDKT